MFKRWKKITAVTLASPLALLAIPSTPSGLTLSPSTTSVDISWQDNSKNETGYKIFRDGILIATVGKSATSYHDSGLTAHTNYTYTVKATDDVPTSATVLGTKETFGIRGDEPLTFSLYNLHAGQDDWLAIFKKGDPHDGAHLRGAKWIEGMHTGEKTITSLYKNGEHTDERLEKGEYEIVSLLNGGYTQESISYFSVDDYITLQPTKDIYNLNDHSVTINLSNGYIYENNSDLIAIFKADENPELGHELALVYTNNTQQPGGDGIAYGLLTIPNINFPTPGRYKAIHFALADVPEEAAAAYFQVVDNNLNFPAEVNMADHPLAYAQRENPKMDAPVNGASVIDPDFHTKITHVKRKEIIQNPATEHYTLYPKVPAWNADMSLLRIGNRLYDGHTYQETALTKDKNVDEAYADTLCSSPSNAVRWSNQEEDTFYLIQNLTEQTPKFIIAKIEDNHVNCDNVVRRFEGYELVYLGLEEGNIDYNDQFVTLLGKKKDDLHMHIILYDILNDVVEWDKELPIDDYYWREATMENGSKMWMPRHIDWVSVSPSGQHIILNYGSYATYGVPDGSPSYIYVYDMKFQDRKLLQYKYYGNQKIYHEAGHGDMGFDQQGNEVFVQFVGGVGIYMFNLDNPDELGQELLLDPAAAGGHISCRNTRRPGYCYVSTYNMVHGYVYSLKLNHDNDVSDHQGSGTVEIFSQAYSIKSDDNQWVSKTTPFASVSPDGTKVIFNSYWGTATMKTYIAEMP